MLNNPEDYSRKFPTELLVIAPLLALSTSFINSLAMGLVFTLVLVISAISVSILRNLITSSLRIPVILVILGTLATTIELGLGATLYELREGLGIYLPLITINALVIWMAEGQFLRLPVKASMLYAIRVCLVVIFLVCTAGLLRELFAEGTVLAGLDDYVNVDIFSGFRIFDTTYGLTLISKPAGALIVFGLLAGCINYFHPTFFKLTEPGT